jgi:hypothetical protein
MEVPLFPGSHPRRLAAISHQPPTLLTLLTLLPQDTRDLLASPVGPRDIASGRAQKKARFLEAAILQYGVAVATDPQKTLLPGVALLLCDVTAVSETRLLLRCLATFLGFQQVCRYIHIILSEGK